MSPPLGRLLPALYFIKLRISKAKLWLWIKLGLVKSIMILPYKGFGNQNEVTMVGRVLQDKGIRRSKASDSAWKNIGTMRKRFMSVVIPGVRIKGVFMGVEQVVISDDEGYFELRIKPASRPDGSIFWHQMELTLLDQVIKSQGEVKAVGQIYVPGENLEYGIISDIDDTIVSTGAVRLWEMIKTTFVQNAHTRIPFPGVSAFYTALEKGSDGITGNPFFYVSSSPWNLYDFLMEFLEVHEIPQGPLMLRDLGLSREQLIAGSHSEHKLKQIEHILSVFDGVSFILIGDSGQEDPEIYLQVVQDFPGRIKMIYIRDMDSSRHDMVKEIADKTVRLGVEILLVKDTIEAAQHSISQGWIRAEGVRETVKEKREED